MKKYCLILLLLLVFGWSSRAQNFEWVKSFGGSSLNDGYSITVDDSGNVYTTGYFIGTGDFDPGTGIANLTSTGIQDVFVQKLDASGNFLWAKSFGGSYNDYGRSITVDVSGNVYTTGYFIGTGDFDPGADTTNLTSSGGYDIFIQKLDASGNFLWAKSFGGNSEDRGESTTIDDSGNVYTTGYFHNTADFDPGADTANLTSAGFRDIFVQKLDASGNFLWAKSFGGNSNDYGRSITVDASGNVYITGTFEESVDFDPGADTANLTSAGSYDVFVQKLDTSGNFLWAKSFGGSFFDDGRSITVDASGNVYTTGYFEGMVDFDPGAGTTNLTTEGNTDVFIQKLDASGNFLWAKSFGSNSSDYGQSITVDASGNVYTTGYFNGTGDFDPGADTTNLTSSGGYDIFVQKIDGSGNFKWAKSFGGSLYEYGWSITVDASGNVYTTGHFEGTVDFDPGADTANLTSVGNNAVFVHKLSQCIITNTDVITACDSYTWPLNNTTYTSSTNTPTVTLANAASCDSVVMLDLTIKSVSNITTTLNGVTLSANNNNATYQWLDCNNNYSIISGETSQSFSPSINGNYAVQLTENGCIDTSVCVSILTIGIIENEFGNELLVSPNPTTGDFSINLGSVYKSAEISISEVNGKLIRSESIENKQVFNMFLKEPPGIYLITIQTGDKMAFIKLIKD